VNRWYALPMEQFLEFLIAQWFWWLALVVVLVLIFYMETRTAVGGVRLLSVQAAVNLINHEQAVLVDIRDTASYKDGHIIHAVSMPKADFEKKPGKLEKYKKKPIIVVCATGQQASQFGASLHKKAFTNVSALKGGIQAWQGADLPLVK